MNDDVIEYLKSIGFKENQYTNLEKSWPYLRIVICEHPLKGIAIMINGGTSRTVICDEEFMPKTSGVAEIQAKLDDIIKRYHN